MIKQRVLIRDWVNDAGHPILPLLRIISDASRNVMSVSEREGG